MDFNNYYYKERGRSVKKNVIETRVDNKKRKYFTMEKRLMVIAFMNDNLRN